MSHFAIYEPTVSFKNSFLPYAIKEWNKLDSGIRNAKTCFLSKNVSEFHKT